MIRSNYAKGLMNIIRIVAIVSVTLATYFSANVGGKRWRR